MRTYFYIYFPTEKIASRFEMGDPWAEADSIRAGARKKERRLTRPRSAVTSPRVARRRREEALWPVQNVCPLIQQVPRAGLCAPHRAKSSAPRRAEFHLNLPASPSLYIYIHIRTKAGKERVLFVINRVLFPVTCSARTIPLSISGAGIGWEDRIMNSKGIILQEKEPRERAKRSRWEIRCRITPDLWTRNENFDFRFDFAMSESRGHDFVGAECLAGCFIHVYLYSAIRARAVTSLVIHFVVHCVGLRTVLRVFNSIFDEKTARVIFFPRQCAWQL